MTSAMHWAALARNRPLPLVGWVRGLGPRFDRDRRPGLLLRVVDDGRCPAETRWLASDPHVPLAVSHAGKLLDGSDCCLAFAERGRRRRAEVGGRARLIGRLTAARRWRVAYLDAAMHAAGFAPPNAYLPVIVLDMTGDGYPEVVFRESGGATWADAILHKSRDTSEWKRTVVSAGGSTI